MAFLPTTMSVSIYEEGIQNLSDLCELFFLKEYPLQVGLFLAPLSLLADQKAALS